MIRDQRVVMPGVPRFGTPTSCSNRRWGAQWVDVQMAAGEALLTRPADRKA
jgi:hypothetical protein